MVRPRASTTGGMGPAGTCPEDREPVFTHHDHCRPRRGCWTPGTLGGEAKVGRPTWSPTNRRQSPLGRDLEGWGGASQWGRPLHRRFSPSTRKHFCSVRPQVWPQNWPFLQGPHEEAHLSQRPVETPGKPVWAHEVRAGDGV